MPFITWQVGVWPQWLQESVSPELDRARAMGSLAHGILPRNSMFSSPPSCPSWSISIDLKFTHLHRIFPNICNYNNHMFVSSNQCLNLLKQITFPYSIIDNRALLGNASHLSLSPVRSIPLTVLCNFLPHPIFPLLGGSLILTLQGCDHSSEGRSPHGHSMATVA